MKKIIGTIIGMLAWGAVFCQGNAQSGINTKTPQQALHVSSATLSSAKLTLTDGTSVKYAVNPSMRIEGLNNINNAAAYTSAGLSGISTLPLYATTNGDLVIGGNRVKKVISTLPNGSDDAIPVVGYIIVGASNPPPTLLREVSFTLSRTSMVYISSTVAIGTLVDTISPASPAAPIVALNDGAARTVGIQLQFSVAPGTSGIPTGVPFASTTDSYTNGNAGGTNVPTGYFWYTLGKEVKLVPGAYKLQIFATGAGNGKAFKFYAGGGTNPPSLSLSNAYDPVNIFAIAL